MDQFIPLLTAITTSPIFLWLGGFALAFAAMLGLLMQVKPVERPERTSLLKNLRHAMGAERLPLFWFTLITLIWATIFSLLFIGLLQVIYETVWGSFNLTKREELWDFRFLLTQLAGLTAVLGAVVALPFTVIRLRLSTEQNAHAKDSLFNDKLNAAIADLHAQRQVTIIEGGERIDIWQDDIIRRNGAIDRLEALADERKDMVQRIAAMLSVYLTELTREYPAQHPPKGATPDDLRQWASALTPQRSDMQRSDMEKAAQVMGRILNIKGITPETLTLSFVGVNLQGCDLSGLDFRNGKFLGAQMQGAILRRAQMQGAILIDAQMEGAYLSWAQMDRSTDFSDADTTQASLKSVDLTKVPISPDQVQSMFGDGATDLPASIPRPDHWPIDDLDWKEFDDEWALWKSNPGAYVPPQDREDS